MACPHCKGFFTKTNVRHHAKNCFSFDGKIRRNLLVMGRKLIGHVHPEASPSLKNDVFSSLREDDVVRGIRYDHLILYGNKMCCKYLLGRFLLAIQKINRNITELKKVYDPSMYDEVISALNVVGGFNNESNMYKAPSVAYNLGSLIKKNGQIFISDCVKRKNKQEQENAENLIKLLVDDISVSVNKTVSESQSQQFRRKVVTFPSNHDIKKLNSYLKRKRSEVLREVTENFSSGSLAESTLISMQIFNRRRAGEIERIFIEDFETCRSIDEDSLTDLSASSIAVANNDVRFEIRGKLNRSVLVLLSKDLLKCIETVLVNRKRAGVAIQNRYLFGIPGDGHEKYLRACKLLRRFSEECGAKFPKTLRDNDISDIANFLGHSEKIHKTIYWQPVIRREILNISRILKTVQGEDSCEDSHQAILKEIFHFSKDNSLETTFKPEADGGGSHSEGRYSRKKIYYSFHLTKHTLMVQFDLRKGGHCNRTNQLKNFLVPMYLESKTYPALSKIKDLVKSNVYLKQKSPPVVKTWISNKIQKNRRLNSQAKFKQ
nr:unnamed protein product [Callosobruchus analis]